MTSNRWRRPNWLRELEIAAWVVFAAITAAVVFHIGAAVYQLTTDSELVWPITVPVPLDSIGRLTPEPGAMATGDVAANTDVTVELVRPTIEQHAWFLAGWLPGTAIAAVVAFTLARQLRLARQGLLFSAQVVRALRRIGWLVLVGTVLAVNLDMFATGMLVADITPDSLAFGMVLPFGWLLVGFVAPAMADVVARGARMREDLEGVV